jgi:hypothetical protein
VGNARGVKAALDRDLTGRPLLTCADLAALLSVPVATVRQWRYTGSGPKAFKVGRHLRYDPAEVTRWLVEDCGREDRPA